jgi:hypothetical protein
MQKQFFALILVAAAFITIGTGCKKDKAASKTKTQLLTQASWKFSSATVLGGDVSNSPLIACIKDDLITFNSNGSGTINEGLIVCNPTTAVSFTWSFQDSESKLVMSSGLIPAGSGGFTIQSLTETTLKLYQDVIIPPSTSSTPLTVTYVH